MLKPLVKTVPVHDMDYTN